jgi:hypothetical protein
MASNFGTHRWNGSRFVRVFPGAAVVIAVEKSGAWLLDAQNRIFKPNGVSWVQVDGSANDIDVGVDGSVWVIGTNPKPGGFGLHRWNGSSFDPIPGGAAAVRVAVNPSGFAWLVNDRGQVFRPTGIESWELVPPPALATDIDIGADGSVWIVGADPVQGGFGVYHWNGSGFDRLPAPLSARRLAVDGHGQPWLVNSFGSIFQPDAGRWNPVAGSAKEIDIGPAGEVWVVGTDPTSDDLSSLLVTEATIVGVRNVRSVVCQSSYFGDKSAVDRQVAGGPAYSYVPRLIRDTVRQLYCLYFCGRWQSELGDGDHTLQTHSPTGFAASWSPVVRPDILQGREEGHPNQWFSNNACSPAVVKASGTYHMFTQVQIPPGFPIDVPGQVAEGLAGGDRIQLHTSSDGVNWQRWSAERGVIVNIDDPTNAAFAFVEAIYVPWDRLPFWLYTTRLGGAVGQEGTWRIRSADPTTFSWASREATSIPGFGNQMGYMHDINGNPLFLRVVSIANGTGRMVPGLHFSRDGLQWSVADRTSILLDAVMDNRDFRDCNFIGLSTLDGTGQLELTGDNQVRFLYSAATQDPGVNVPHHIGVGICYLNIFT